MTRHTPRHLRTRNLHRNERDALVQTLMAEYGDAMPPGRIVAAAVRAARALALIEPDPTTWASMCETETRRLLDCSGPMFVPVLRGPQP